MNVCRDYECSRVDNRDLVDHWRKQNKDGRFVQTKSELNNINITQIDKLLGER